MLLALTLLLGLAVPVMAEDDCPSREFLDVPPEGHWAHAGIDFMIEQGYMSGTSTTQKIAARAPRRRSSAPTRQPTAP